MSRLLQNRFCATGVSALVLLLLCSASSGGAQPFRDPTRPPRAAVAAEKVDRGSWTLSSVLVSPARRVALLNGRAVQEGALIDGARVVAIEAGRVRLRQNRQEFSVALQNARIKEPAADAVERTWEQ